MSSSFSSLSAPSPAIVHAASLSRSDNFSMPSTRVERSSARAAHAARSGARFVRNSRNSDDRDDHSWPGREASWQDKDTFESLLRSHAETHSIQEALRSVRDMHDFLINLQKKDVIPNKNAMQIYLQHCCAKSASFDAEYACLEAAGAALDLMEQHGCTFDTSTVVQIAMHISLRAESCNVASFVRRLIRKTLTHLSENERLFIVRHMTHILAERKEAFDASLWRSDSFAEQGIQIDWERSTAQEFHLYNCGQGHIRYYKPEQGYGFAKKGLSALLSIDNSGCDRIGYEAWRDGALVDVVKAKEGEPLVVRLKTHLKVPFEKQVTYRLENIDAAEVQTKRMMETLKVLGRDPHPQCERLLPDSTLCDLLLLPPEERYKIRITLGKAATLEAELEFSEYGHEPIRVRSLGKGILVDWNKSNPENPIRVGDRIESVIRVGDRVASKDRESIIEEIQSACTWKTCELKINLMRKVKAQNHGIQTDCLLPNAEDTKQILATKYNELRKTLNESQVEAVLTACTRRLSLIQGPPGTGKTTTAVDGIIELLLTHDLVPTPILVSGHTNAAVDNILSGLIKKGRRVVRIGDEKVREECKAYVLGEEKAADPATAEVICATCISSGSGIFAKEGIKPHTVLIDECSQATETACLVPICHGAQHVILIGDQCQLQPFVQSELSKMEDLGNSLFNRLCQQGVVPAMLDTQYRMHPVICDFPSGAFYAGHLLSGVRDADRKPTMYWPWPSPTAPVCFVDAKEGWEAECDGKVEKKNMHEATLVVDALKTLLRDPELNARRDDGTYPVGIVTPYAAQKELIKSLLDQAGFVDENGKLTVETNSVDGFQGREKDMIIFSAVRANSEGAVGFLHDWRRVNVMLTRAKRGLIIFGHRDTLQTDLYWKSWLKWASVKGCIQGESASGSWTAKCLIEDEWIMKPKDFRTHGNSGGWMKALRASSRPSSQEINVGQANLETSSRDLELATNSLGGESPNVKRIDSWESLGITPNADEVRVAYPARGPLCIAEPDSWEELISTASNSPSSALGDSTSIQDFSIEGCDDCSAGEEEETFFHLGEAETEQSEGNKSAARMHELHEMATSHERSCFPDNKTGVKITESNNEGSPKARVVDSYLETNFLTHKAGINDQPCDVHDAKPSHATLDFEESSELVEDVFDVPEVHGIQRFKTYNEFEAIGVDPLLDAACHSSSWRHLACETSMTMMSTLVPHVHSTGRACMMIPMSAMPSNFSDCSSACGVGAPVVETCCPSPSAPEPLTCTYNPVDAPVVEPSHCSSPALEPITCAYNPDRGVSRICWRADAKQLKGKKTRLVSPPFVLCFGEHLPLATFRLMIHPESVDQAHDRLSSPKSALSTIKLKCESDLRGIHAWVGFSIAVSGEQRGPISHNFSSRSVGELPTNEALWDLKAARDPKSMTVAIILEALPYAEIQDSVPSIAQERHGSCATLADTAAGGLGGHGSETTMAIANHLSHGNNNASASRPDQWRHSAVEQPTKAQRCRSEAGQQRQRERRVAFRARNARASAASSQSCAG